MKFILGIFLCISIVTIINCDQNDNNFGKKYETTLLLTYITSSSDANGACVTLSKKQEECFSAPAAALGITVTTSSDASLSSKCVDTLKSSQFHTMSAIAQTCVINCQITDWNTKISSGECKTATASSLVQSSLTNAVVSKCIRSCFLTTNGTVSDSELTKLFIFNFIQQGD